MLRNLVVLVTVVGCERAEGIGPRVQPEAAPRSCEDRIFGSEIRAVGALALADGQLFAGEYDHGSIFKIDVVDGTSIELVHAMAATTNVSSLAIAGGRAYWVNNLMPYSVWSVPVGGGDVSRLDLSGPLDIIAVGGTLYVTAEGGVYRVDAEGSPERVVDDPEFVHAITADGRRLYYVRDGDILGVPASGGRPALLTRLARIPGVVPNVRAITVRAGALLLRAELDDDQHALAILAAGSIEWRYVRLAEEPLAVTWADSGILFTTARGLFRIDDDAPTLLAQLAPAGANEAADNPIVVDGSTIYVASGSSKRARVERVCR